MQIVLESKRVLEALYKLLTEDSYCLTVKLSMKQFAEKLNISNKHLNLCLHYLVSAGYITCDVAFNSQENAEKDITFTALGINKVENQFL